MSPSELAVTGARRAALALHALSEQDRDWVLDAVPEHQAKVLRELLQDLHRLGIPPLDPRLQESLTDSSPADRAQARLHRLGTEDLHALACLLRREPARVARLLLDGRPWPWRRTMADHLQMESSEAPQRTIRGRALQDAVERAVAKRLTSVAEPARVRRGWIQWLGRVGARRDG